MNLATDLEDEEDFFWSNDAEQASVTSAQPPHEFDADEAHAPSQEQLAHFGRFRTPVALVVAAMGLLSVVALAKRESSERQLVAHYGSALPAPVLPVSATVAPSRPVPASSFLEDATASVLAVIGLAPAFEPAPPNAATAATSGQADSNLVSAFLSATTQMCLRHAESESRASIQTSFTLRNFGQ